jgi:hypothetical protein
MALILEANYSKKIGLPEYSSHQFSVSLRSEITDLSQVPEESARLYHLLQDSVDQKIQDPGFLPNGSKTQSSVSQPSNTSPRPQPDTRSEQPWKCSEKQAQLINNIIQQNQLDVVAVEELSITLFDKCLRELNKIQASGLIDRLLEEHGGKGNGTQKRNSRFPSSYNSNGRQAQSFRR